MVTVYRHFDKDGVLLYIGCTRNLSARTSQHRIQSSWGKNIIETTSEYHKTIRLGLLAEKRAIMLEHPKHNIVFTTNERNGKLKRLSNQRDRFGLTPAMKGVVLGIARNKTVKDIAMEYRVYPSRISNILMGIYDTLGFTGRACITHWAIQNKLVKLGDYEK